MKCRKHKIIYNQKQARLFNKWLGVYRWTYNQCCNMLKNKVFTKVPSIKLLRSLIINIDTIKQKYPDESQWILKVPYDIRDKAAFEFIKNFKLQSVTLGKKLSDFELHFKSKKQNQSLEIDTKHWHDGTPFTRAWKQKKRGRIEFENKRKHYKYSIKPKYAVRLLKSWKSQQFLIATPSSIECPLLKGCDNQATDYKVVFFDPGVRTFLTGYDSEGRVIEFGVGYDKLLKLSKKLDKAISASQNVKEFKHRCRYKLKKRVIPRIRSRIKNIVNDMHWKCAKFICNNYTDIHLPVFEVSRMINKNPVRKLASKTSRMMCNWSHYRFSQILKYRATTTGCRLFTANEAYTSRTCCRCGNIKSKSTDKTSKCNQCGLVIDRDINGAICICLRQCTVKLKNDL